MVLLGASRLSVGLAGAVLLVGSVVYTTGELRIAPVSFAWLLQRGPQPIWPGLAVVSLVGALLDVRLGAAMPQAAGRVTNRAAQPAATP